MIFLKSAIYLYLDIINRKYILFLDIIEIENL